MSKPVCKFFAKGNCKLGNNCKFLHQQQPHQQQQQNTFGSGRRAAQYPGGNGGFASPNRFAAFDNRAPQQQQAPSPPKDHKCGNPRECRNIIRDDQKHERPSFWRATSYSHYKYVRNDIIGDVSPEELRWEARQAEDRGESREAVIQREKQLFSVGEAAFNNLLNNPYTGPATSSLLSPTTSPALPPPGTALLFGKPIPAPSPAITAPPFSTLAAPFGQTQPAFGSAYNQAQPAFGSAFNQSPPPPSRGLFGSNVPSHFGSTGPSFGFGGNSPPLSTFESTSVPTNLFQSQVSQNGQFGSPFGPQPSSSPLMFGHASSALSSQPSAGMFPSVQSGGGVFGGLPNGGAGSGPFEIAAHLNMTGVVGATPSFGNAGVHVTSSQTAILPVGSSNSGAAAGMSPTATSGEADKWLAEKWSLGQIPDEEPPAYAR